MIFGEYTPFARFVGLALAIISALFRHCSLTYFLSDR